MKSARLIAVCKRSFSQWIDLKIKLSFVFQVDRWWKCDDVWRTYVVDPIYVWRKPFFNDYFEGSKRNNWTQIVEL